LYSSAVWASVWGAVVSFTSIATFSVIECADCHVPFAITKRYDTDRRGDQRSFYCPNGHSNYFPGKSDAEKLKDAEARNVHLQDQLWAAEREAEARRIERVKDRVRWAKGMCPCCRRNFSSLAQHVRKQHPDFDAANLTTPMFKCSCGRTFPTFQGLRVHQGVQRPKDWDNPKKGAYWRHLTVVGS
jgi:hypothetical protein